MRRKDSWKVDFVAKPASFSWFILAGNSWICILQNCGFLFSYWDVFFSHPQFLCHGTSTREFLFCFCYVFNFRQRFAKSQIHIRQRYVADFWYLGASGCSLLRRLGYQTGIRLMPKSRVKTCFIYMGYGYGLWSSIPCHGNPYIFMYIYITYLGVYIYIFQWIDHAMAHLPPHGTAADGFSQSQGMVFNKGLGAALSHRENV